jgi:hypothetical protein
MTLKWMPRAGPLIVCDCGEMGQVELTNFAVLAVPLEVCGIGPRDYTLLRTDVSPNQRTTL